VRARALGHAADAVTTLAGALQQERPARVRDLAGALAARALLALAALGAGAAARIARPGVMERQVILGTEHRVLERQLHDGAQVRARLRAVATCAPPATAAEQVAEDVAELAKDVLHVGEAGGLAGARQTLVPEAVVRGALVGVAEHRIGLGALFEPLLGLLVAGIPVGVQLESHLAVGALDLDFGGRALDR
jgi:hypothetical protein